MSEDIREFMDRLGDESSSSTGLDDRKRFNDVVIGSSPASNLGLIGDMVQWSVMGNDSFTATGSTVPSLPPGSYKVELDNYGRIIFVKAKMVTDTLLRLPDTASDRVLESIKVFWNGQSRFRAKGQLFKRGVLLWGPPGSGKTSTVQLLISDLVERGGIVLLFNQNPSMMIRALTEIRRIESTRPIICVMEDLDELTKRFGEAEMLSLLDGESQVDNIVHVASTNYPESLDPRFVNRPSRFDEIIKIGMPSKEARLMYLRSRLSVEELNDIELQRWVDDTEEMSIAHLRELVVAVFCLGREYKETLDRLRSMKRTPKSGSNRTIGMLAS